MFDNTDLRTQYTLLTSVRSDLTERQEIGGSAVLQGTHIYGVC